VLRDERSLLLPLLVLLPLLLLPLLLLLPVLLLPVLPVLLRRRMPR
jgi:hypothetical protein